MARMEAPPVYELVEPRPPLLCHCEFHSMLYQCVAILGPIALEIGSGVNMNVYSHRHLLCLAICDGYVGIPNNTCYHVEPDPTVHRHFMKCKTPL